MVWLKNYQDKIEHLELKKEILKWYQVLEKIKCKNDIIGLKRDLEYVYFNSAELFCLIDSYQELVNQIFYFFQSFGIISDIDIFVVYSYLVRNGFLSLDHHFVCTNEVADSIPLLGANVIEGSGVCRHIASFLTDIYKRFGYVSANISVVLEGEYYSFSDEEYDFGNINFRSNRTSRYNHLVSLVKGHEGTLLFDALNDYMFFVWNDSNVSPVFCSDILVSYGYEDFFNYGFRDDPSFLFVNTKKDVVLNLENRYREMFDFCEKNSCYFEEFYSSHCELFQDITNKKKVLSREFSRYLFSC